MGHAEDEAGGRHPARHLEPDQHAQVAEQLLAAGFADMVSLARPMLADPDFVRKAAAGHPEQINVCIACNQACLDHIFVGKVASCLVNPRACHETELNYLPTPRSDASQ